MWRNGDRILPLLDSKVLSERPMKISKVFNQDQVTMISSDGIYRFWNGNFSKSIIQSDSKFHYSGFIEADQNTMAVQFRDHELGIIYQNSNRVYKFQSPCKFKINRLFSDSCPIAEDLVCDFPKNKCFVSMNNGERNKIKVYDIRKRENLFDPSPKLITSRRYSGIIGKRVNGVIRKSLQTSHVYYCVQGFYPKYKSIEIHKINYDGITVKAIPYLGNEADSPQVCRNAIVNPLNNDIYVVTSNKLLKINDQDRIYEVRDIQYLNRDDIGLDTTEDSDFVNINGTQFFYVMMSNCNLQFYTTEPSCLSCNSPYWCYNGECKCPNDKYNSKCSNTPYLNNVTLVPGQVLNTKDLLLTGDFPIGETKVIVTPIIGKAFLTTILVANKTTIIASSKNNLTDIQTVTLIIDGVKTKFKYFSSEKSQNISSIEIHHNKIYINFSGPINITQSELKVTLSHVNLPIVSVSNSQIVASLRVGWFFGNRVLTISSPQFNSTIYLQQFLLQQFKKKLCFIINGLDKSNLGLEFMNAAINATETNSQCISSFGGCVTCNIQDPMSGIYYIKPTSKLQDLKDPDDDYEDGDGNHSGDQSNQSSLIVPNSNYFILLLVTLILLFN
ncbi:hypothetical protein CYY_006512 [Polysphondylium violaceum]|uniref:Uncharacterized protein n=1 Tax=Polysphondylium violaceum TaxID=133409 RepID=A0A8J4PTB9_9MYCE|nr:hypothetical protein CYY_006512 [Polysphondylium violaceum]